MIDRAARLASVSLFFALAALPAAQASAQQPSLLFYQNSQDQARSFDVATLAAGPTLVNFLGGIVGNARNIQADGDDGLLWYADAQGNIRSKVIASGDEGPTVPSTVFLGANPGADRHFSLDPWSDLLYYSVTDGSLQIIDLASATQVGTIPATAFLGANPGGFRHTAIDSVNRRLYYASTDNGFYSFSLDDFAQAGPSVSSGDVAGAAAGAFRHLIYDPNSGLLWYAVTDGSVHSVDPVAGVPGPTLSGNNFTDVLGAGRIITMTFQVLPEPAALASGLAALCALGGFARLRPPRSGPAQRQRMRTRRLPKRRAAPASSPR